MATHAKAYPVTITLVLSGCNLHRAPAQPVQVQQSPWTVHTELFPHTDKRNQQVVTPVFSNQDQDTTGSETLKQIKQNKRSLEGKVQTNLEPEKRPYTSL